MSTPAVDDGPYELRYRLERADIAALIGMRREVRGFARLALLAPFLALAALVGWLETTETGAALGLQEGWGRYAVLGIGAVALLAFKLVFSILLRNRAVRRAEVPAGETMLVAGRAGLRLVEAGRTLALGWNDIAAVRLGRAHVVLTPRTGPATVPDATLVVPERAFADYDAMLRFYVFADEAAKAAREEAGTPARGVACATER